VPWLAPGSDWVSGILSRSEDWSWRTPLVSWVLKLEDRLEDRLEGSEVRVVDASFISAEGDTPGGSDCTAETCEIAFVPPVVAFVEVSRERGGMRGHCEGGCMGDAGRGGWLSISNIWTSSSVAREGTDVPFVAALDEEASAAPLGRFPMTWNWAVVVCSPVGCEPFWEWPSRLFLVSLVQSLPVDAHIPELLIDV
jgi:hypothetical protein